MYFPEVILGLEEFEYLFPPKSQLWVPEDDDLPVSEVILLEVLGLFWNAKQSQLSQTFFWLSLPVQLQKYLLSLN
jgi:hypothetical protein